MSFLSLEYLTKVSPWTIEERKKNILRHQTAMKNNTIFLIYVSYLSSRIKTSRDSPNLIILLMNKREPYRRKRFSSLLPINIFQTIEKN